MSRRSSPAGFTLIEALVVMGIIGVMILVAAPVFAGQRVSSQDAEARQYLEQAYRLVRAQTIDVGGKYGAAGMTDAGALTGAINLAYPEYLATQGETVPDMFRTAEGKVKLAVFVTSAPEPQELQLRIRSASNRACLLSSTNQGLPEIDCI